MRVTAAFQATPQMPQSLFRWFRVLVFRHSGFQYNPFAENIEILMEKNLGKLAVGQAFYAEPLLLVIPQVVGGLAQL